MKKTILMLCAALLIGCGSLQAKKPHHRHGHNPKPKVEHVHRAPVYVAARPAAGMSVTLGAVTLWFSNGEYYKTISPSRYEVVAPPMGMLVPKLHKAKSYKQGGTKYYVSHGVIYEKVKTPKGKMYKVVGFQ